MSEGTPKPPGPLARWRERFSAAPLRTLGLLGAIVVGIGFLGLFSAVEFTSRPQFCGSCHIMTPYYQSWKHSKHSQVPCVECHIPPGVTAEIRKKYEALSMVVKYFTATYGTNPWAEVEDAACLRCHERRLLIGKATLGDVQFDHAAHLSGMRRGKTLRCTSCHSQIVQGNHMAVTTTTCILCHFKDTPSNTGTARCTLCHTLPDKTIQMGSFTFSHADVARFGIDCSSCHARPQGNGGDVPRERCVTCHNQPARLEKYSDTQLLHEKHVTEHKVDCMYCHLKLEHVEPVGSQNAEHRILTASSECQGCHEGGHSPQLALYTGTGGRGVPPMPSPMYQAGVRCEGCHFRLPGQVETIDRASDISCMSCHGAGYRTIYLSWTEGAARRSAALRRQIDETGRAVGGSEPSALADARYNLRLVERGRGVHNIGYSYALLRKAHQDMNAARKSRGLAPLPLPWQEPSYESPCRTCHEGIDGQRGQIFGRTFAHAPHIVDAKLQCQTCHRPHAEKPKGEVVRFDAGGCEGCHHKGADVSKPAGCMLCHGHIREAKVKSFLGSFSHVVHIEDAEKTCGDCHDMSASPPTLKRSACEECH